MFIAFILTSLFLGFLFFLTVKVKSEKRYLFLVENLGCIDNYEAVG